MRGHTSLGTEGNQECAAALGSYEGTRIVTRIAAEAARSPSVWIKKTHIHRKYEKIGEFRLTAGFKRTELSRNSARGKERADRPGASALSRLRLPLVCELPGP